MDRDLPEGVAAADPPGGWESVDDEEARERDAEAADAEALLGADDAERELLTDAALQPDDPVEGEAVRQGADPDLIADADRGEEP